MEKRVTLGFSLSTAAPCAAHPHWTCTPSNRYRDREPLPMTELPDPRVLLAETFGPSGPSRDAALVSAPGRGNLMGELLIAQAFGQSGPSREAALVSAPGRVNLIGKHIDYNGLPVLPIAIRRSVRVAFRARPDRRIRAVSAGGYGVRDFAWTADLTPTAAGDWENYLRAAACAVGRKWGTGRGVDAAIVSDLPPAAGLSSSSALIVAFTLSLLRANAAAPTFEELMEVLPEGEQFVGTRGGGMDHAASLASQTGCASLIEFDPLAVRPVPIPPDWAFLVAHSLTAAEKSGAVRQQYNACR